jgi:hypothetical protein
MSLTETKERERKKKCSFPSVLVAGQRHTKISLKKTANNKTDQRKNKREFSNFINEDSA